MHKLYTRDSDIRTSTEETFTTYPKVAEPLKHP